LNKKIIYILISTGLFYTTCDNKSKLFDSKKESNEEIIEIEETKYEHKQSIDTLQKEIIKLSDNRTELEKKKEFIEASIYNILKKSYLDHVIVGSEDLSKSRIFFNEVLGFNIKDGKIHKNGIENFFIEFNDSTEIEIISVENVSDKLANEYKLMLQKKQFGLQFAIRTPEILELKKQFSGLNSEFTELVKNRMYTTLSKNYLDQAFPLFFIEYNSDNINKNVFHSNNTKGISDIWLSTTDVRKSVQEFVKIGFSLIDTLSVGNIEQKTVLIKNNNINIILIENDHSGIYGLTIKTVGIKNLLDSITDNLNINRKIKTSRRGKSIFINPEITNSIWLEFLEN